MGMIYYVPKCFTESEQKEHIIELELLITHFAIRRFRPYVSGTYFMVRLEHRPLVYLFNLKGSSSKLSPIRLELSEYNCNVEDLRERDNVGADALSRISIGDLKVEENLL